MDLLVTIFIQTSLIILICKLAALEKYGQADRVTKYIWRSNNSDNENVASERSRQEEKWVVDWIYYDDYQSDSPSKDHEDSAGNNTIENNVDMCPPVSDKVTDEVCSKEICQKDTDCETGYRCCFTGCSFSCLLEIQPAAVLDWKREPRRSRSGISWLISGSPSITNNAEPCSIYTENSDEDPLLCPHGYYCHVTDTGNPSKKQPSSGYCVKEDKHKAPEESLAMSAFEQRKVCTVDNIVLLEGASIRLPKKHCQCKKGQLSCTKPKSQRNRDKVKFQVKRRLKKRRKTDV